VKPVPAATWRTRQQAPTPDRYKEIQQALVNKGYLKTEPNGVWDADSSAAMQRFQMDQKLTPTGKINAPSLIGLGLGAKSAGAPEAQPIRQESVSPPAVPQ
jgi:peptidoglycan hydrolase-like protein with peptidoglycan-binding domain